MTKCVEVMTRSASSFVASFITPGLHVPRGERRGKRELIKDSYEQGLD